jgi:hypothetical protein
MKARNITAKVQLPSAFPAVTKLRLRAPENAKIKSVILDGKPWTQFNPDEETITIPAGMSGTVHLTAQY